jgi:hypothetical protein
MNPNPWKARLAKWAKQWPVPIEQLQAQAFAVLQLAYEDVAQGEPDERRRHVHVYFTALACFTKLLEASEVKALAERLAVLEKRLQAIDSSMGVVSNGHWS